MELKTVALEIPDDGNIILGQSHFIKTVEDIYEAIVNTVPQMKFGVAFCEASGACLIRADGNDDELKGLAIKNAQTVAAGHTFVICMKEGYPINLLTRIKDVPEVVGLFCATSNRSRSRHRDGAGQGCSWRHRWFIAKGVEGRKTSVAPLIVAKDRYKR